jgi:hypothetical protein
MSAQTSSIMKTLRLLICALPLSAAALLAQPTDGHMPPPGPPGEPGRRPPPPLMAVLDTNHDGILSAEEIANAPKSLLLLDKNGDGQLTPEELRPPRPEGGGPGGHKREGTPGGK